MARSVYYKSTTEECVTAYPLDTPPCKEQNAFPHKPCAAAGSKLRTKKGVIERTVKPKTPRQVYETRLRPMRLTQASPEFNLEKGFQRKMKSKKFKAQLSRIIFKQASTADRLVENRARQQHELAMENPTPRKTGED